MTVNYEINKTDGSIFVTVPQGTSVDQAGLTLIGKNYVAFGEALNENIVHLAENFASVSAPLGPLTGQLWYDKSAKSLKVYSGAQFSSLVTGTFQGATPTSPVENQLWYDTNERRLYVYNGGSFRLVGPTGIADTQVLADTIVDTSGASHTVLRVLVNNKNVAIITDETFVPAGAQVGFKNSPLPTLAPGINIGNDTVWDFKIRGLATVAETLKDGSATLSASNIVRNNQNGVIAGTLNADNGLSVGSSSQIQIYPESNNLRISNTTNGGDIYLQTTNGTGLQSTVSITTGQSVGINTASPAATLHVAGTGTLRVNGAATFLSTATGVTATASDNTTKFATTAHVKLQFNDTVLTGAPTATGLLLSSENSTRIATTAYVKAQFDNTDLTGIPTVPYISNLAQSDNQAVNTKFVQDVVTGTLVTKANVSDLTAVSNRVTVIEGDYALKSGNTFTGTHNFTGATVTVATPSANSHAVTKLYVDSSFATIASPAFTGAPTAPTPLTADNSTKLATTAWVNNQGYSPGIAGITAQDEGSGVGTSAGVTTLNFTGAGVSVSNAGGNTVNVAVVGAELPINAVIMWYGTVLGVPAGWSVCDGTNGTPDLRDRFIVGAGSTYAKGATGGSGFTGSAGAHSHGSSTSGYALTAADLPSHSHTLYVDGSTDTDNVSYGFNFAPNIAVAGKSITGGAGAYRSVNGQSTALVGSTGTALAHSHAIDSDGTHTHTQSLPLYYALYYIMKTS